MSPGAKIVGVTVPQTPVHHFLDFRSPGTASFAVWVPAEVVRVVPGPELGPDHLHLGGRGPGEGRGGQKRRMRVYVPGFCLAISSLKLNK